MAMSRLTKMSSINKSAKYLESALGSLNSSTRAISSSPSLILKQSSSPSLSHPFLPNSAHPLAYAALSRNFSTYHGYDLYERYRRRTAVNWGVRFVPQQEAYVIERFGKFSKVLEAGLHVLIPFVDRIAYVHSLKEQTIEIPEQPAVTTDNVSIRVNGVLFVKVVDAEKASYGNDNVMIAVTQLAQTVMRSAIGKMPLDRTFMERDTLNANIVDAINDVASQWGLICRRYEIRDIIPPPAIRDSMEMQAEAERKKRAEIIEAEGKRQAIILTSEAAKMDSINRATGEAEAIRIISEAVQRDGGQSAASLKVAQDYVQAFNKLAKESTTILLPANVGDGSSMVAQALTLYKNLIADKPEKKISDKTSIPAGSGKFEDEDESSSGSERPHFSLQSPSKEE